MVSVAILNTWQVLNVCYYLLLFFLAAPKPQVQHVPALQEHASEYLRVFD